MTSPVTVVVLHVGPVQSFIAAARKFSDLALGSACLSGLAGAAADGVRSVGGELVFPASSTLGTDVQTWMESGVANKVVAVAADPAVARRCSEAALGRVRQVWEAWVQDVRSNFGAELQVNRFAAQAKLEDWLEFFAAWATRPDYDAARRAAERLLDGRKRTRDFPQPLEADGSRLVEKSWYDAGREDVLVEGRNEQSVLQQKLLVKRAERLDAITAVKRLHGQRERFESINRVAVASWLAVARATSPDQLADYEQEVRRLSGWTGPTIDGAFYFPHRVGPELREAGREIDTAAQTTLQNGWRRIAMAEPTPYYALFLADGDGMGAAISDIRQPDGHRAFSGRLHHFSESLRCDLGDDDALARVVYAGGDDVLVILSLEGALALVQRVGDSFVAQVGGGLTLSGALVVAHMQEPLERVRAEAQAAEREAKAQRRAAMASLGSAEERALAARGVLCLRVLKRSGAPLDVFGPLASAPAAGEPSSLPERLDAAREFFALGQLSSKAGYELRTAFEQAPIAAWHDIARVVMHRKRVRQSDNQADAELIGKLDAFVAPLASVDPGDPGAASRVVTDLSNRLVLGRFLHQQRPRRRSDEEV